MGLPDVRDADASVVDDEFAQAVIAGLSRRPRTLPCKFFYDARGSELFEEITRLPEYYPTRTETAILRDNAAEIVDLLAPRSALVELGSGSSLKTEILLSAGDFSAYAPIDVSPAALSEAVGRLARRFPDLPVRPIVGDFTSAAPLPSWLRGVTRTGFFPGSTIGNFSRPQASALLAATRAKLGAGAHFIVGVDMRKDVDRLIAAYDDAAGVTAAFNRNLLVRMRAELGADVDPDGFAHEARYDAAHGRIEMHLVARRRQTIAFEGHVFDFAPGETIHTENSHKYSDAEFSTLAQEAGWRETRVFTDAEKLFSVRVLQAA